MLKIYLVTKLTQNVAGKNVSANSELKTAPALLFMDTPVIVAKC